MAALSLWTQWCENQNLTPGAPWPRRIANWVGRWSQDEEQLYHMRTLLHHLSPDDITHNRWPLPEDGEQRWLQQQYLLTPRTTGSRLVSPEQTFQKQGPALTCHVCGSSRVLVIPRQTRSADEATDYFYQCDRGHTRVQRG